MCHKKTVMLRTVIVEDEPPMLRFLHRILSGLDGFQITGECLSAQEALELMETSEVDLLISDIRMPGMSGLQLAERFRSISEDMHIVIITGYKSFEYAKTAIDLNIDAFITKPIDQQEFREVLFSIRESYQKKYFVEIRSRLGKALQYNDDEQFAGILSEQRSGSSVCMVFYSGDMGELFGCLKQRKERQLYVTYKNMAIFFTDKVHKEELFHYICVKFSTASRQRHTVVCVLENTFENHMPTSAEIKEFYRKQLLQILVFGKFTSYSGDSLYEKIEKSKAYINDEADFKKLEWVILARKWDQLWIQMEQLFEKWKKDQVSAWSVRKRIHGILGLCSGAGILKNDAIVLSDQIGENILCFDSYEEIREYVCEILRVNINMEVIDPSCREIKLFSQIRDMVFQNLSRNFSLQEICAVFGVSQPYVRKIFTQFTGKTYNDYVLEEKMKAAVRLINRNPDIPVKDLAAMLGYDSLYFGTVFKKSTGFSPSQYKQSFFGRKKNLRQEEDEKSYGEEE